MMSIARRTTAGSITAGKKVVSCRHGVGIIVRMCGGRRGGSRVGTGNAKLDNGVQGMAKLWRCRIDAGRVMTTGFIVMIQAQLRHDEDYAEESHVLNLNQSTGRIASFMEHSTHLRQSGACGLINTPGATDVGAGFGTNSQPAQDSAIPDVEKHLRISR